MLKIFGPLSMLANIGENNSRKILTKKVLKLLKILLKRPKKFTFFISIHEFRFISNFSPEEIKISTVSESKSFNSSQSITKNKVKLP